MTETIRFLEEERQLILLALGHLAVRRPGWDHALRDIAAKLDGERLFMAFKETVQDSLHHAATPKPPDAGEGER